MSEREIEIFAVSGLGMPPKLKRQKQSAGAAIKGRERQQEARSSEQVRPVPDTSVSNAPPTAPQSAPPTASQSAPPTAPQTALEPPTPPTCEPGPSYNTEQDPDLTPLEIMREYVDGWIGTLERDNKKSVAMLLCYTLVKEFADTETRAAETTGKILKKSDKTIRRWRTDLVANNGTFSESKQGRYQRSGVLLSNEELSSLASEYVCANSAVKRKPNMTILEFCKWVNKSLPPNSTIEPGFPRKIGVETARKWLHETGFEVLTARKGIFIDGHEREDVVLYCKEFLRRMIKIGFLHFTNAPTETAQKSIPDEIEAPTLERSKMMKPK